MFTDTIEEVCLNERIPLRQLMSLAVYNSGTRFTNVDEIVDTHLETYRGAGGYKALPDYVRKYVENRLSVWLAIQLRGRR